MANIESDDRFKFIDIDVLKSKISDKDYSKILLQLLDKSRGFYETNIIFPRIMEVESWDKTQVNEIGKICLRDFNLCSFVLQGVVPEFIKKHNSLIEDNMKTKLLNHFCNQKNMNQKKIKHL